jgi:hypothetical protein
VLSDPRYSVLRERPFGSYPGDVVCCALRREDRSPVRALVVACFAVTLVCAVQPLENSKASTSIFVLQATKSQRWMPWRLKPKKDVGDCEKPRGAVYLATIRGYPNGATQHLS